MKEKTVFVCDECGYETGKWMGKCPSCNEWNTLKEFKVGEKAIDPNERYVQWYIVLTGVFKTSEGKKLLPGDTFGNLEPVNKKKWEHIEIVAKKPSSIA